jgi:hypothetical protein
MGAQFDWKRIRQYFVEFSNNPRVVVSNPDSKDDFRTGRVIEINADGTIKVAFEEGPGNAVASFERCELETILDGVKIKLPGRH